MPCSRKCLVLLTLALTSRAEDAAGHLRGPSKEDAPATPSAPADHGLTELVRLIEVAGCERVARHPRAIQRSAK